MPDAPSSTTTLTARLLLRAPTAADLDITQLIHSDPRTQRYNPAGPDSRESCQHRLQSWIQHWQEQGFGYWVVCDRAQPERVLGFGGVMHSRFGERTGLNLYFRFAVEAWGQGYASEMAGAALHLAFRVLGKEQVIGLVRPDNLPSRRALERLGLTRDGELDDFPDLAPSLLYSLSAEHYFVAKAASPTDTVRSLEP
ncbi:Protein export cytoplasm protein SecA ATPase RNA helicase [Pseudomonas chlororaphis subsp. aurantiaca]|uniref:GNAT family N-acetyltransferase n=1 Tax=Pseudomonas chlororaphis TaxID=587753 RepID=UPI000F57A1E0|nr:GNAT family N-acetyltransferase [Pseudomonas chlororaphis]AZD35576.1 Protein export cytoplasm protein SecA ATPase RNA helicase [Pseudomonas chlororaphis subsp. aurantiaca]AZD41910.1 Protein export cytoplasm protein SecA ATPase RNA helicase [Pseudomonas chlororaphis subsp. aurantiaca]